MSERVTVSTSKLPLAVAVAIAVAALTTSHSSRADDSSVAAATVLFDEAIRLMEARRFDEACPRLARSHALAPTGGTLLALGDCYENSGKVASAWLSFREAAVRAANAEKRDAEASALDRARRLEPRLPRLRLTAPVGSEGSGLEVRRGGVVVKGAELGVAVPVDPGPYEIVVSAPGKRKWIHTVALAEGAQVDVAIPSLVDDDGTTPFGRNGSSDSVGDGQRNLGLVIGGVGVASLVVGGVFGLMASSTNDDALERCTEGAGAVTRCDARGLELTDSARSKALVSTVVVIAGAVLSVTGGVLFFTAPRKASTTGLRSLDLTPMVGRGAGGAAATMRW